MGLPLPLPPKSAVDAIKGDGLLHHIKTLSSDEFEGRAPGTKGEELSVNYITDQFKSLGLKPGNPNGSHTQEVPLAGIATTPTATFTVKDQTTSLRFPDDYVASSARLQSQIDVKESDIVFVGYGIVAPEFGWNDYKVIDVKAQNDPDVDQRSGHSRSERSIEARRENVLRKSDDLLRPLVLQI